MNENKYIEYSSLNNNVILHYFDVRYYFNIYKLNKIIQLKIIKNI